MKKNGDKKQIVNNKNKSRSERFWDLFVTGGWFSFEKEWKNSKSLWHTLLMFLVPILIAGIIILITIVASKTFH